MPAAWSAWSWVNSTASTRFTPAAAVCRRRSGEVSIRTVVSCSGPSPERCSERRRTMRLQRLRAFFGFDGSHAPQSPSARGTPPDEPQPRITYSSAPFMLASGWCGTGRKKSRSCAPRPRPAASRGSQPISQGSQEYRPVRCDGRDAGPAPDKGNRSRR